MDNAAQTFSPHSRTPVFDPEKYDIELLVERLQSLRVYCAEQHLDFESIQRSFVERESSEDFRREMEIHATESKKLMEEYYASTQMYLYELTVHECTYIYRRLFESISAFCQQKRLARVLDYGGGVGGLTLHLRKNGIRCDYADVKGETWRYAEHRFSKAALEVPQFDRQDLQRLSAEFDCICSLDCFEHLSPLSEYLALFSSLLKPGGILISLSTFHGIGLHIESNHKYNSFVEFDLLMQSCGFQFVGQLVQYWGIPIVVPPMILSILGKSITSGRRLVYRKKT